MKKLSLILLVISVGLLQGCGDARWLDCIDGCSHYRDGQDGQDGAPGTPGLPGQDGSDGHDAVIKVNTIPDSSILPSSVCPAGGYEYISATDLNDNGLPDVTETNYSVSILCNGVAGQDGSDGQDGQNGSDGADAPPTPFTMVGMIDPCGKQGSNSAPDEVFILLANGQLIASFSANSNGNMTRFSSLIPNANSSFSGGTTDQTGCGITISRDNANNVTLTTSNGLGQANWTLVP